jgi:4-amino-4-deoxy-L-arabinose transferase-like glycosyltransferase
MADRGGVKPTVSVAEPGAIAAEQVVPHERLWLLLVLVVGASLRVADLGDGLWFDEILALVTYVRRPLAEIVTRFDTQNQHMLYSVLAHVSVQIFGESPWALRLPAAVFGVASLWATWWFGTLVVARREALLAAAFLAVSSHHVWFSQDARGYSMLLFWSLVGSGLFLRLLKGPDRSRKLVLSYAAVMALATWTQVAGGFVVAAHVLVWGALTGTGFRRGTKPAREPVVAIVLSGALGVLLYAPVLPAMMHTLAAPGATGGAAEWKSPLWFAVEATRGLTRGVPGGWIALLAGSAVAGVGVLSFARRSLAVTLLLLLPGVVTAVVMLATAHNLWPRLFFFAWGFAALIAVRGGFAICAAAFGARGPPVATIGAVVACAASALTVPRIWLPKQDFVGARTFVEASRGPGDLVVTVDMTRLPYRDYYQTDWLVADSLMNLESFRPASGRTWLLYTFPERLSAVDPALWEAIRCCFTEARRFPGTVQGGTIWVMVRG